MKTSKKELYLYRPAPGKNWRYRERIYEERAGRKIVKKLVNRSLDTTDENLARDRAWDDYLKENGLSSNGPARTVLRSGAPTLGEVTHHYLTHIQEHANIQQSTAQANVSALLRLVSLV